MKNRLETLEAISFDHNGDGCVLTYTPGRGQRCFEISGVVPFNGNKALLIQVEGEKKIPVVVTVKDELVAGFLSKIPNPDEIKPRRFQVGTNHLADLQELLTPRRMLSDL